MYLHKCRCYTTASTCEYTCTKVYLVTCFHYGGYRGISMQRSMIEISIRRMSGPFVWDLYLYTGRSISVQRGVVHLRKVNKCARCIGVHLRTTLVKG